MSAILALGHEPALQAARSQISLNINTSNSKRRRKKRRSPFALLVAIIFAFFATILLLFGYYVGYHPSMARLRNLPPIFNLPTQEGNSIRLTWNIDNWFDKYNVHWHSSNNKDGQIDDIRSGEAYFESASPGITYKFVVQGCVEDRFFDMTIHSTCTNWSNERHIRFVRLYNMVFELPNTTVDQQ